jgi:hypothetical protein
LLHLIGQRTKDTRDAYDAPDVLGFGVGDLKELGRAIFNRINSELHQLFCGGQASDKEQRQELEKILRLDPASLQAGLTIFLISTFGLDATIAAIIAVLLLKRVILPAGGELCAFWAKNIAI